MGTKNTVRVKAPEGKSFFSRMEKLTRLDPSFENGLPVRSMPYVIYITLIGILYIGNLHYADRTIRKINKLQIEIEELRADYTTLKSDYMKDSKQSEVARKVEALGLEESVVPPYKVAVNSNELKAWDNE